MPDLTDTTTGRDGTVARRVRVSGHVQGVFFRDSTWRKAREHGVAGWVRNEPDGTVAAVLEGPAEGVGAVVDWMRAGGPPRAQVAEVHTEPVALEGHQTFNVRH